MKTQNFPIQSQAHNEISDFLERVGIKVTRQACGLETSFLAEYGTAHNIIPHKS